MPAKPGPHQLGAAAMRMQGFDGLGERNRPVVGDRRALFGLAQAGVMRRIGGQSLAGENAWHGETEQENGGEQSGDRHGRVFRRVPVNAG